jgi:polysaccharide biosynthesis/export protein
LPGSGPSAAEIEGAGHPRSREDIRFALIQVTPTVVAAMEKWEVPSLHGGFGQQTSVPGQTIGVGDSIQIVIWEAASGGLFSSAVTDRTSPGSRSTTIPEQIVGNDGAVTVPYVSTRVRAAGRTPSQVEQAIVEALKGKAIEPQAVVTVTKNVSNTVTVIGEVTNGARVPLTLRGDRILDVVAAAGGVRVPTREVSLTLIRHQKSVRVPMQAILQDPRENIPVEPGDVITVARDPLTFTAVGATAQSDVIPFENVGFTLEEAIGKAGGLNDQRADPQGVFVIRFEPGGQYDSLGFERAMPVQDNQVPVIYRLNMRDSNAFFLARRFPMRNKDILFVSNSSVAEMQKLFAVLSTLIVPGTTAATVTAAVRR